MDREQQSPDSFFVRSEYNNTLTRKALETQSFQGLLDGTPGAIRTHGLQSRSLTLYPTELRARNNGIISEKRCVFKGFQHHSDIFHLSSIHLFFTDTLL